MTPHDYLRKLQSASATDRNAILENLAEGCPIRPWPFGMPSSACPYVVLLGLSPGASPAAEDRGFQTEGKTYPKPTFGSVHDGFNYRDTKGYWNKARDLCQFLVNRDASSLSESESLAISSHLNLGTGQHGEGSIAAVDINILGWISRLLHEKIQPKILVGFGLSGVLTTPKINALWNESKGLGIDWTKPAATQKFGNYNFRLWTPNRKDGSRMAVLLWPNHPSRHPFTGYEPNSAWTEAKQEADNLLRAHGF